MKNARDPRRLEVACMLACLWEMMVQISVFTFATDEVNS